MYRKVAIFWNFFSIFLRKGIFLHNIMFPKRKSPNEEDSPQKKKKLIPAPEICNYSRKTREDFFIY
jgi:hypothetical protein